MSEGTAATSAAASNWFTKLDSRLSKSGLGRMMEAGKVGPFKDTVSFLNNASKGKRTNSMFLKLLGQLPQGLQTRIASAIQGFEKLPGMNKMANFVKIGYMFDAVTHIFGAGMDAVEGFQKSQGSFIGRIFDGVKSGIKSAAKRVGTFGASLMAGVAVTAMMGTGVLGIVGALGASMLTTNVVKGFLDKMWGTHSHTEKGKSQGSGDPQQALMSGQQLFPEMNNDIINSIDRSWDTKDYLRPYLSSGNPWLRQNNGTMTQ